jgi:hypothetical protein
MLSIHPSRRARLAADTEPYEPTTRRDVCPPSLVPQAAGSGMRRWLRRLGAFDTTAADPLKRVLAVREEFALALEGIDSQHAQFLQHRIRHQRSLRELWHLRAEMFVLIAQAFTEHEAERRMAPLARHFPLRAPF